MTVPKTSFDIPFGMQMVNEDGTLTTGGQELLSKFGAALSKLRMASENMDTLAASPTVEAISTAWNEMRQTLQEIV